MGRTLLLAGLLVMMPWLQARATDGFRSSVVREDWGRHFKDVRGCFVLVNGSEGETGEQVQVWNPKRASERFAPCSTFKIPNTVIGLETGVITGPDFRLPWDGKKRMVEAWNADQSLESAFRSSTVWFYQEVARRTGRARMTAWVRRFHYGNMNVSGPIDRFWLDGSLRISAREQTDFLKRLWSGCPGVRSENREILRHVMRAETTSRGVLFGKTGTMMKKNSTVLGWYVGVVETQDRRFFFACNIHAEDGATGSRAKEITRILLASEGIL